MIVDPNTIVAGEVVTMRDTFVVTEVTATHIWNDQVAYPKVSLFPAILRSWDVAPGKRPESDAA